VITTSHTLSDWLNYMGKEEIEALKILALSLPDNPLVINIGAGAGTSGLALLESRPDLSLVTIDKNKGDTSLGSIEGEVNAFKGSKTEWEKRTTHIVGFSAKVGQKWIEPVDLVFIDGDHSYKGCKADIEAWLPHIKKGGAIVFHDYQSGKWPDVKKAVDEAFGTPKIADIGRMVAFRV